jgi:hypothetical protein
MRPLPITGGIVNAWGPDGEKRVLRPLIIRGIMELAVLVACGPREPQTQRAAQDTLS